MEKMAKAVSHSKSSGGHVVVGRGNMGLRELMSSTAYVFSGNILRGRLYWHTKKVALMIASRAFANIWMCMRVHKRMCARL